MSYKLNTAFSSERACKKKLTHEFSLPPFLLSHSFTKLVGAP